MNDRYVNIYDTLYIIMCEWWICQYMRHPVHHYFKWWILQYMRHPVYHYVWVMDMSIYETPCMSLCVSDRYVNIWDTLYIMWEWWIYQYMRDLLYHYLWVMDTSICHRYVFICKWSIRRHMRHQVYHYLWVMDTSIYDRYNIICAWSLRTTYDTPGIKLFVSDGYVNKWDTRYNSVIRAIVWCATRIVSPLRC